MNKNLQNAASLALSALLLSACSTMGESAEANQLTVQVGIYPPPPPGLSPPRVGVPVVQVSGGAGEHLEEIAADQLTTLALRTDRFDVIERARLETLLDEQGLEGIVDSGELARPAAVRGIDYLLIGRVTNFRVKAEKTATGFGVGQVAIPTKYGVGGVGGFDLKNENAQITTECGVDLRLVDPSTGSVLDAHFGDFKRTDTVGALGVQILGVNSQAEADLELSEDDQGLLLRLALDDAVRKMLPSLDRKLVRAARASETPAAATASETDGAAVPAAGPQFCSGCGTKLTQGSAFCGQCGAKVQQ